MSYLWCQNVRYGCSGPCDNFPYHTGSKFVSHRLPSSKLNHFERAKCGTVGNSNTWFRRWNITVVTLFVQGHQICSTSGEFRIKTWVFSGGYDINKIQHGVFRISLGPSPPAGRNALRPSGDLTQGRPGISGDTKYTVLYSICTDWLVLLALSSRNTVPTTDITSSWLAASHPVLLWGPSDIRMWYWVQRRRQRYADVPGWRTVERNRAYMWKYATFATFHGSSCWCYIIVYLKYTWVTWNAS